MSHLNGRIYIDTSVTPNIGISTDDVAYVIGENTGDVGTLCRSTQIKPFAKYKPLPIGNMAGYTDAAAKLINYGLHVPYYTRISDMAADIFAGTYTRAANYDSNKTPFEHTRLATTDWFRLLDFNEYDHNSAAPYGIIYPDHKAIELWENIKFELPHTTARQGQMARTDFRATDGSSILAEDMRLGLLVYCNNPVMGTNQISYITMDYSEYSEHFPIYRGYYSSSNVIVVCAFLSSVNTGNTVQTDTALTGYFIPLTFTRARIDDFVFEQPYMNYLYDSITPFNPYGSSDEEFVWALYPNGAFNFIGHIEALDRNLTDICTTGDFTLPLTMVKDDNDEIMPIFVKVRTNVANSTAIVKVFEQSNHPGISYWDVYSETYQGATLTPDYTETVSIISGSLDFPSMNRYLIQGQIGNSEYGYSAWGGQIPD